MSAAHKSLFYLLYIELYSDFINIFVNEVLHKCEINFQYGTLIQGKPSYHCIPMLYAALLDRYFSFCNKESNLLMPDLKPD